MPNVLEPTGRVVVYPNSVFFQPSVVFKQALDYVCRSITLVSGGSDYAVIKKRLLTA
jgi:hypothetical protein